MAAAACRRSGRVSKPPTRLVTSPEQPNFQKPYTLDKKKALQKKLRSCDFDAQIHHEEKHGNHIFTFSTGVYELYKSLALSYFQESKDDSEYPHKISMTNRQDEDGAIVETKIQANTRTSKGSGPLRFAVMLYHTTSRMMINGKYATLFFTDNRKIIAALESHPGLNSIDHALRLAIYEQLGKMEEPYTSSMDKGNGKATLAIEDTSHNTPIQPTELEPQIPSSAVTAGGEWRNCSLSSNTSGSEDEEDPLFDDGLNELLLMDQQQRDTVETIADIAENDNHVPVQPKTTVSTIVQPLPEGLNIKAPTKGLPLLACTPVTTRSTAETDPSTSIQSRDRLADPSRNNPTQDTNSHPTVEITSSMQAPIIQDATCHSPVAVKKRASKPRQKKTDFSMNEQEKQLAACKAEVIMLENRNQELQKTIRTLKMADPREPTTVETIHNFSENVKSPERINYDPSNTTVTPHITNQMNRLDNEFTKLRLELLEQKLERTSMPLRHTCKPQDGGHILTIQHQPHESCFLCHGRKGQAISERGCGRNRCCPQHHQHSVCEKPNQPPQGIQAYNPTSNPPAAGSHHMADGGNNVPATPAMGVQQAISSRAYLPAYTTANVSSNVPATPAMEMQQQVMSSRTYLPGYNPTVNPPAAGSHHMANVGSDIPDTPATGMRQQVMPSRTHIPGYNPTVNPPAAGSHHMANVGSNVPDTPAMGVQQQVMSSRTYLQVPAYNPTGNPPAAGSHHMVNVSNNVPAAGSHHMANVSSNVPGTPAMGMQQQVMSSRTYIPGYNLTVNPPAAGPHHMANVGSNVPDTPAMGVRQQAMPSRTYLPGYNPTVNPPAAGP
ncbi:MAG: hypothetical protein ABW168_10060, partial [Sedimenticola sp.]